MLTLAQLMTAGAWQLSLTHDRADHLLIWITRGQGVAVFDGTRTGIGTHNAIFLPARSLMSFELGRQCFGQALLLPSEAPLTVASHPIHLRIRDAAAQNELTALLEALGREQSAGRPLAQNAMAAYADLVTVWLRRAHDPQTSATRVPAARRLTRRYSQRVTQRFSDGSSMAEHAADLGVTPTHLTRACKAEIGKTAASLLTERILHASRTLLTETKAPARDIARHLGFGSAAYFTRFIQHHTGLPPSALRNAPHG
ncbi:MAG: AraC family transcriptional regulator [Pseudomonadota bacterium]